MGDPLVFYILQPNFQARCGAPREIALRACRGAVNFDAC
jgi:hypothetical protein